MTNDKAIEYLIDVRNGIHIPAPGIELPLLNDKEKEAIDLAISALEKQEADKCCETCKYKSRSSQETPCCDCYMSSCFEDCYEPYTEEEA
jgi:hypothetical protein